VAYPACALLAGAIPSYIPLYESSNFKIDPNILKEKITSNTKALLFGFPANPTGSIMSYKELTDIANIVKQKDILVISDEIYERLVYETDPICFAGIPGMRDSTVVLGGFSKTYAMTGWRVGYALARREIIDAMTKIHQYTMLCAPIMAQNAALCALQEGENDVNSMVSEYNYRRRFMYTKMNEIGLPCSKPMGAFYCFPSVKNTGMSSEEFATKLLYEEKVAVVPGDAFGEYGEGYIRCCYATSLTEIEEAIGRMRNFINKHSK
jgi:aminotransferase